MSEGILRQNLGERGEFQRVYLMYLLFETPPQLPDIETMCRKLAESFPEGIEPAGQQDAPENQILFSLPSHLVSYQEGDAPALLLMGTVEPLGQGLIAPIQRTQQWECPESEELLKKARYQLLISDFMAAGLPYLERCEILTRWSEAAVRLFPECLGVWFVSSGKLVTPQQILENPYEDSDRFLLGGMNIRYFAVDGTKDFLVATLGLYAVGIADVQYHFHDLNPDDVVDHAFRVASYQFAEGQPIENGETVEGFSPKKPGGTDSAQIQWPCSYELSLIQPRRRVLDIQPGRFAAGRRRK